MQDSRPGSYRAADWLVNSLPSTQVDRVIETFAELVEGTPVGM